MQNNIARIAVDGGPCSGKSTGLAHIVRKLADIGIIAFVVPEAATLLIQSGVAPWTVGLESFQRAVARLQIQNEEVWTTEALAHEKRTGKKCVLLCDRGLVGAAAYLPGDRPLESLNTIFGEFGLDMEKARTRYVGVIHLVTAADGAEEYYTLANNQARTETPEQARALDKRTMAAWLGHPHLAVIPNVDRAGAKISFEKKIYRASDEVFRILGYPLPLEIEDKYLLKRFDPTSLPVPSEAIEIAQSYLASAEEGSEERVRARTWLDCRSYFHTIKRTASDGARIEIERMIDADAYALLMKRADPSRQPVNKTRHCFIWNAQYFEVDVFRGHLEGLLLMEREKTDRNESTDLPPFIAVACDVTDDPAYRNSALAKR